MAGKGSWIASASSPARRGRSQSKSTTRRRLGSASAVSVRSRLCSLIGVRSQTFLELEAGRLFHVLVAHVADGLREGPVMTLRIFNCVGAVAVELVLRRPESVRAGRACTLVVLVDAAVEAHVNPLRIHAAERSGALGPLVPFGTDHDAAVRVTHLGVHDVSLGISQDMSDVETEDSLQPLESCAVIPIDHGRNECRTVGSWSSHGRLLIVSRYSNS